MKDITVIIQYEMGNPKIPITNNPSRIAQSLIGAHLNHISLGPVEFMYQNDVQEVIDMLEMVKHCLNKI